MILDNKGQLSLEYLLIFSISLIILIVFTLPLANEAIENILDSSDVVLIKNNMNKIANGINQVYSEGESSKRTVYVEVKEDIQLDIHDKKITTDLYLRDNLIKHLEVSHSDSQLNTVVNLYKGVNKVVIEWPDNSTNIIVRCQY